MSRPPITNTNYTPHQQYSFYAPKTGIYTSKHPNILLPTTPHLDLVTHIFSFHQHDNFALIDSSSGVAIPYSDLLPLVKSTAFALHHMGISPKDRILLLLPNSIYYPILFLGVLYLGAVVIPMNPLSSFSEVIHQTLGVHVSLTFCLAKNDAFFKGLGFKVIVVPDNDGFKGQSWKHSDFYRVIFGNVGSFVARPRIKQDDVAAILYSSGTTGVSKGVELTHRNFIAMVELFVRFEGLKYREICRENAVYLAVLPMFHIYGLALFGAGLISLGSSVVVMSKFDIGDVVNAIEKYKVTHFPVVPPILAALNSKAKSLGDVSGLSSLKQVSSGAAPLKSKTISEFLDTFPGVDLIQGYGMTESTAVGTRGLNVGNVHNYTSVGLLAPNMEAKVINWSTGSCLPPGEAGELLLRGPGVMKGYLNNKEATRLTIEEDGWLHTGDLAYFDHDGYLYILDRLKEIIKYKGYQIAPADLEAILISHTEIDDVAVVAAPNEEAGEIPVAFVVRRPGSLLSRDEVIKHVAKEVAPHKKVREVVFVTSIPRSPAGKVLRRHLRNLQASKL